MLADVLANRSVVACVGSGGVGKTTVSAALGVRAALEGRRTLVLTIDPARRLANSLGLSSLGNVETRIEPEQFARVGLKPKGELWAMTLDLRRTWDDVVTRYAPTPDRREKILGNRLYRQLSTSLAGSLEYMAMEKVYELHRSGEYDLVVLDTPPTAHALDFLDAPNRLLDMLGNDAVKWMLGPALSAGKVGLSLFGFGSSYVFKTLARFTGVEMLRQMADFFVAFQGMYEGFKERAGAVKGLLSGPKTGFVLVTSPAPMTMDEAVFFAEILQREGIGVAAAVINRVHLDPTAAGGPVDAQHLALALARARVPNEGNPHLSERLAQTLEEMQLLALRDAAEIARFREATGTGVPIHPVPRFDRDVHDLAGLHAIGERLFAPSTAERG